MPWRIEFGQNLPEFEYAIAVSADTPQGESLRVMDAYIARQLKPLLSRKAGTRSMNMLELVAKIPGFLRQLLNP